MFLTRVATVSQRFSALDAERGGWKKGRKKKLLETAFPHGSKRARLSAGDIWGFLMPCHMPPSSSSFLNAIFIQISFFFFILKRVSSQCARCYFVKACVTFTCLVMQMSSTAKIHRRLVFVTYFFYTTLCFRLFITRLSSSLLLLFLFHPSTLKLLCILGLRTNHKQPCFFFFFPTLSSPCLSPNHPLISSHPLFVLFEYGM